jgi:ribosomal protein S18 acetylase RimI-like enzyme
MLLSGHVLRACEFGDLDQVGKVEKASFPERPYSRLDFAYLLLVAREGFVVACRDGMVVGYVIAMQGREGMIQSIAVSPDSRRKGIGEILMRSAIEHLTGKSERVSLLVDVKNESAIRLYRRFSFVETGKTIRGYYPDGGDAAEMVKELPVEERRPPRTGAGGLAS